MKTFLSLLFVLGTFALGGCAMESSPKFTSTGVPADDRYIVGGGYVFRYTAPSDGTFYIVERGRNRVLFMIPWEKERVFVLDDKGLPALKEQLGQDFDKAVLVLYFIPSKVAASTQPTE